MINMKCQRKPIIYITSRWCVNNKLSSKLRFENLNVHNSRWLYACIFYDRIDETMCAWVPSIVQCSCYTFADEISTIITKHTLKRHYHSDSDNEKCNRCMRHYWQISHFIQRFVSCGAFGEGTTEHQHQKMCVMLLSYNEIYHNL